MKETNGERMKVKELIEELKKFDSEKEVIVFAAGDSYTVYNVKDLLDDFNIDKVEIGCGWMPTEEQLDFSFLKRYNKGNKGGKNERN